VNKIEALSAKVAHLHCVHRFNAMIEILAKEYPNSYGIDGKELIFEFAKPIEGFQHTGGEDCICNEPSFGWEHTVELRNELALNDATYSYGMWGHRGLWRMTMPRGNATPKKLGLSEYTRTVKPQEGEQPIAIQYRNFSGVVQQYSAYASTMRMVGNRVLVYVDDLIGPRHDWGNDDGGIGLNVVSMNPDRILKVVE
jgi:hypothetical protein